jgi:ribose 5-phosphate isomerase A
MTHPTYMPGSSDDPSVHAVAQRAIELIPDGARVGLGSGRAASVFITKLGARWREGFRVSGVPTSRASADAARRAGIPLIELGDGGLLDLTVDGADEVAPGLDLIKGRGGALVRERIVAAASSSQVILVGKDKLVGALGQRGPIPVEVIPIAEWLVVREVRALGLVPTRRMDASGLQQYVTDNGNIIVDCALPDPIGDASAVRALEHTLLSIVGVVDTGLFLGTADRVLVGCPDGQVDVLYRHPAAVSALTQNVYTRQSSGAGARPGGTTL